MVNTQALKLNIIELVMNIDDDELLAAIEQEALSIINRNEEKVKPDVMEAIRPIRKHVSLEEINRKQPYTPFNYEEFREAADELALQEPVEELLKMLTK